MPRSPSLCWKVTAVKVRNNVDSKAFEVEQARIHYENIVKELTWKLNEAMKALRQSSEYKEEVRSQLEQ